MRWTFIHTIIATILGGGGGLWMIALKTGVGQAIGEWIGKRWFPERRKAENGNGYLRHTDFERFITTVITRPEFEVRIKDIGDKIDSNGAQARTDRRDDRQWMERQFKDQWEKIDGLTNQILINRNNKKDNHDHNI